MGIKFFRWQTMIITVILCMVTLAGCGISPEKRKEEIREALILAYQFLENQEYDSAIDAFTKIIEIDEKYPEAYIGLSRAYSAAGQNDLARETAAKGKEATETAYFENMENMYGRLLENEALFKELADFFSDADQTVPLELDQSSSGILSDALDRLWEKLDSLGIYDPYSGDVLVFPVDPVNNIYLLLYPDGHFYFGEIRFSSYSDILARTEDSEENEITEALLKELVIPFSEGHGLMAGIDQILMVADLYIGEWKLSEPDGNDGLYVYQSLLASGCRYVYHGAFDAGRLSDPEAVFGSTDFFLLGLLSEEEIDISEAFDEFIFKKFISFDHESLGLLIPVEHIPGAYSSDFMNREYFEMIDQGLIEEVAKIKNREQSSVSYDGDMIYLGYLGVSDFNASHGLYIISGLTKGIDTPNYVIDAEGNTLFSTYDDMVWFTSTGFRGMYVTNPGEETPFEGDIYASWQGRAEPGDIYKIDFDWEGREISREYAGILPDVDDYYPFPFSNAVSSVHDDVTAPGSTIQAERTEDGLKITDSNGNYVGTIQLTVPDDWLYNINGRMIEVFRKEESSNNVLFLVLEE